MSSTSGGICAMVAALAKSKNACESCREGKMVEEMSVAWG
jgi:hypothetical protein